MMLLLMMMMIPHYISKPNTAKEQYMQRHVRVCVYYT